MTGSPTMRRRRLATELRQLRTATGMSVTQVAGQLGWQASKLSRIETRKIGVTTSDVRRLLDLYGMTDEGEIARLLDIARHAKERGWWESYGATLPSETQTMIGVEAEASDVRVYYQGLIPGLLQTPDYARAVIRATRPNDPDDVIAERLDVRMARQQVLKGREAPRLRVVLNEGVIHQQVGSPEIMAAQLRHVVAESDRLGAVVQVLPFTAGEHAAIVGSFVLYDFPATDETGVVYVELMNTAIILEKADDLTTYRDAFERASATALSPRASRDLMLSVANGCEGGTQGGVAQRDIVAEK